MLVNRLLTWAFAVAVVRAMGHGRGMRMLLINLAVLLMVACGGAEDEQEAEIVEVRVDHPESSSASNDIRPRLCADGEVLHVVWQDLRDGESAIWYNRSEDGGATWLTSDVRLDDDVGVATAPDVSCGEGRVYAVWVDDGRDVESALAGVQLRASVDGGLSFGEAHWVDGESEEGFGAITPVVAAQGASVAVAWADSRNGAYDIFVNVSTDAAATWFVSPVRVDGGEAGEAWSADPQLAISSDGRVAVAWEDGRDAVADVYLSISPDYGQSFSEPLQLDVDISAMGGESMQPTLAMDGENLAVSWHEGDGQGWGIAVTQSDDGGETWSDTELISDVAYEAFEAALAWDQGHLYAAWHEKHDAAYDVMFAMDGGEGWSAPVQLDTNGWGNTDSYEVRLIAGSGEVIAAWHDRRYDTAEVGMNDLYFSRSVDGGESWFTDDVRLNGGDPGNSYAQRCQISRHEQQLVGIWEDGRFGYSGVVAVVRDLDEVSGR